MGLLSSSRMRTGAVYASMLGLVLIFFHQSAVAVYLPAMGDWEGRNGQETILSCNNTGTTAVPATLFINDATGKQIGKKTFTVKKGGRASINIVRSTRKRTVNGVKHFDAEGKSGLIFIEPRTNRDPALFKVTCSSTVVRRNGLNLTNVKNLRVTPVTGLGVTASAYTSSNGDTISDSVMALTAEGGNWTTRYGLAYTSSFEAPIHPQESNFRSTRLVAKTLNAAALQFVAGSSVSALRNADVSFRSGMAGFNHLLSAPAYDQASIGRIGAALFQDRLFIQFNRTEYPSAGDPGGCEMPGVAAGTNLFPANGVALPRALKSNHWYRLNAQIRQLPSGLEVKGIVQDLENGAATVASVTQVFPASCTPRWYNTNSNSFLLGFMGEYPGATIYVDDFVGRPAK